MLITDNKLLIDTAKKNYRFFKVPTRAINPPKSKRTYSAESLADLDSKTGTNKIGEIVNLSQELNSLFWDIVYKLGGNVEENFDSVKEIYYDACQLDVMSNIEIDKAKKEYTVDTNAELKKMRAKYANMLTEDDNRKTMPAFLGYIAGLKNYRNDAKKNYTGYETSMDYLIDALDRSECSHYRIGKITPIYEIFRPKNFDIHKQVQRQVDKNFEIAKKTQDKITSVRMSNMAPEDKSFAIQRIQEEFKFEIDRYKINETTMYLLVKRLWTSKDFKIKYLIFNILFNYKNLTLLNSLNQYPRINEYLISDKDGDIKIYGKSYKITRIE